MYGVQGLDEGSAPQRMQKAWSVPQTMLPLQPYSTEITRNGQIRKQAVQGGVRPRSAEHHVSKGRDRKGEGRRAQAKRGLCLCDSLERQ
jgi:hypothetical protein